MTARLRALVTGLEMSVAERTEELDDVNARLRIELAARETAQAQIIQDQRNLVIAEEHERIGRDLHDGLGQSMGYLNVEMQTVQTLLGQGQTEAAMDGLQHMAVVTKNAYASIRGTERPGGCARTAFLPCRGDTGRIYHRRGVE